MLFEFSSIGCDLSALIWEDSFTILMAGLAPDEVGRPPLELMMIFDFSIFIAGLDEISFLIDSDWVSDWSSAMLQDSITDVLSILFRMNIFGLSLLVSEWPVSVDKRLDSGCLLILFKAERRLCAYGFDFVASDFSSDEESFSSSFIGTAELCSYYDCIELLMALVGRLP
jgi:hypothetical protein